MQLGGVEQGGDSFKISCGESICYTPTVRGSCGFRFFIIKKIDVSLD